MGWVNAELRFNVMQMEKQIEELRKQRDLAQSRLEDYMRMVEHDEASKVLVFFPTISLYATDHSIAHHVLLLLSLC